MITLEKQLREYEDALRKWKVATNPDNRNSVFAKYQTKLREWKRRYGEEGGGGEWDAKKQKHDFAEKPTEVVLRKPLPDDFGIPTADWIKPALEVIEKKVFG